MDIVDLLVAITKKYKEKESITPAKTKLLKLAYLAEVYYTRLTGKRLTDKEWVFWKYGPYLWDYDELISNEEIFIKRSEEEEFYPVEVRDDYQITDMQLDEYNAIFRALEHASDDLNHILDFVYFDTEPMMKAKIRGEKLDFTCIMPEEVYTVKKYEVDKKQGREGGMGGMGSALEIGQMIFLSLLKHTGQASTLSRFKLRSAGT